MEFKFIVGLLVALPACVHGQVPTSIPRLAQAVECMLRVLKTVPGVSEPKLDTTQSSGVMVPIVEYRAAEKASWTQPTRFVFQPESNRTIWFQALLPGLISTGTDLDWHVTKVVVKKWKAQCGVEATVLFE